MVKALALVAVLLVVSAPVMTWAREAYDPHVETRAEAGLPASSAEGEVRIFSEDWLSHGSAESLVARRDAKGRWRVSHVLRYRGKMIERRWRLDRDRGAALEVLLDDPATLVETPPPPDRRVCLDPPSSTLDIRWRGHADRLAQTCGPWGSVEAVETLLMRGRD